MYLSGTSIPISYTNFGTFTVYLKEIQVYSQTFLQTNVIHIHNYNLRDSNLKIFPPRPQSEAIKKSFTYKGAALWNVATLRK